MTKKERAIIYDASTDQRTLKVLAELGLTPNEALLYSALLALGPSPVLRISKGTNIKRSTAYSLLSSLMRQGLVHEESKGIKRLFAAENPERLEAVLNKKRTLLKNLLPELSARYLQLRENESFIRHYRGLNGIKSIYDKLLGELKPRDYYYVCSDQQKWYQLDPGYFQSFIERRAKLNLDIRLLLQDSPSARANLKTKQRYNEQLKIFPAHIHFNLNMVIVPHKVITVQTVEPLMAMVMENPSLVHMVRVLFEMVWDSIEQGG